MQKHRIHQTHLACAEAAVVFIENYPVTNVALWSSHGSRFDEPGKEGAAHLYEHLVLRHFLYDEAIIRKNARFGINVDGETWKDVLFLSALCPNEQALLALTDLLSAVTQFSCTQEELDKERNIILEEIQREESSPASIIYQRADQDCWPNNPRSKPILGTPETLATLSLEDINEAWSQMRATTKVVIITGSDSDFSDKDFPPLQKSDGEILPSEPSGSPQVFRKLRTPGDGSVQVALSYPTLFSASESLEKRLCQSLFLSLLADNPFSLLNVRLRRESGITYYVQGYSHHYSDTGLVRFLYSCDAKNFEKSLDIFRKEMDALRYTGVSQDLLVTAQQQMINDLIKQSLYPGFLNWWYGWGILFENELTSIEEHIRSLEMLDLSFAQEIIQEMARQTPIITKI